MNNLIMRLIPNKVLQHSILYARILKYAYNIAFTTLGVLSVFLKSEMLLYSSTVFLILAIDVELKERIGALRLEIRALGGLIEHGRTSGTSEEDRKEQ